MTKLNAATGGIAAIITTAVAPTGIVFDGTNIWITNNGEGSVTELNAATDTVVNSYPVGEDPVGIAFDGTNIWVANSGDGTATELDGTTGAVIHPLTVGATESYVIGTSASFGGPTGVAFDGSSMWFATDGNTVTKVAISDGTQTDYPVGIEPEAIAFDGSHVWVTNFGASSVTELNASNGARVGTYAVGAYPEGIAFDGTNVWVANSHADDGQPAVNGARILEEVMPT